MSGILVNVTRGGMVEARHRGDLVVADSTGRVVFALGEPRLRTYWRSAAKPFQAVTLVEEGGMEHFGLDGPELAVIAASHGGEEEHLRAVASLLAKIGCSESDLACGAAAPLHPPAAESLMRRDRPFTPIHNNCSGKHAGMLALCRLRDWSLREYWRPDHPVQKNILDVVAEVTATPAEDIVTGVDGCGVPVFWVSLDRMALAYARLAGPRTDARHGRALKVIRDAMVRHPFFVAGTGRLDTALMEATGGRVAAKAGAEGVYCAALVDQGLGLSLKIEDGAGRAVAPVVIEVMRHLGWLTEKELARLEPWRHPVVRNHRGEVVGELFCRL